MPSRSPTLASSERHEARAVEQLARVRRLSGVVDELAAVSSTSAMSAASSAIDWSARRRC